MVDRYPDRSAETTLERPLEVVVDPVRARFSAWYELFPRSTSPDRRRHGTFARRHRPPAVRRRAGLRRPLPAADPSDRPPVPQGRATTTPRSSAGDPGSPWAIGGAEGGHTAVHPELGTLDDFDAPREGGARRAASRSRSTSPSRLRPTTRGSREHPRWFRAPPRRHDPLRREPAQEIPGHLPVRLRDARTGGRCGTALHERRSRSGSSTASRSSASTTRTPSLRRSGSGDRRDQARPPGRDLPGRGVHRGRKVMYRLAKLGFSQSLHLLHVAQREAGADRVLHRAHDAAGRRVLPPELLAEHAGHPARGPAGGRPAGVRRAARARGDARRRTTASTGRRSSWASNAPREPGSEEYLDSEKYQVSALGPRRPDRLAAADRARQPRSGARIRRCSSNDTLRFHRDRQRRSCSPTQAVADGDEHRRSSSSTSTRTTRRAGIARAALGAARHGRRTSRSRCTTC